MGAAALALFAGPAQAATIEPSVKTDDITVNGNCTLREAVQAANTNAAVDECRKGQAAKADVIALRKGDYDLSIPGTTEDLNQTGDLDFLGGGELELRGRGLGKTEVAAIAADRAVDDLVDDRLSLTTLAVRGGGGVQRGGTVRADAGTLDASLRFDRTRLVSGTAQFGGGLGMVDGKLRVARSVFQDNQALVTTTGLPGVRAIGGGINLLFDVDARIADTTFRNNDAVTNDSSAFGGAISYEDPSGGGGPMVVRRSLFTGNDAYSSAGNAASIRRGGAIYLATGDGVTQVTNSTFYSNRAFGAGASAVGGALYSESGNAEFVHTSFAENQGDTGSALFVAGGSLELSRSALDGTGQGQLCSTGGGVGDFESGGYNAVGLSPFGCSLDGPRDANADPLLAAGTADNGGPTETLKLAGASPAIDRVPKGKCGPAQREDQRDFKRPVGDGCDSGAYERGAGP